MKRKEKEGERCQEPTDQDEPDDKRGMDRRRFLRMAALACGAGAAGYILTKVPGQLGGSGGAEAAGTAQRTRRWTMLIDLRKCDGCSACTDACRDAHDVPEGQEWIKVYRITTGTGSYFLPRPCMHCDNAPCLKVCPVGATFRSQDGLILVDEDRCIGCRYCMAACPYDARYFNWSSPADTGTDTDLSEQVSRGHLHHKRGVVEKCTFCAHRLDNGKLPACAEGCPMKAIYFGDANEDFLSNGVETIRLSKVLATQQTFRYKEELGTGPHVIYLPARR